MMDAPTPRVALCPLDRREVMDTRITRADPRALPDLVKLIFDQHRKSLN
jgi:hypothetical protein